MVIVSPVRYNTGLLEIVETGRCVLFGLELNFVEQVHGISLAIIEEHNRPNLFQVPDGRVGLGIGTIWAGDRNRQGDRYSLFARTKPDQRACIARSCLLQFRKLSLWQEEL